MLEDLDYDDQQKLLGAIVSIGDLCYHLEHNHFELTRETNGEIGRVANAIESLASAVLEVAR